MKRYYPPQEEREALHRVEEELGIRPTPGEAPSAPSVPPRGQGITRMTIAAWRELWLSDPAAWMREIHDRPRRFDSVRWRRAVTQWWNHMPKSLPRAALPEAPLHGVPTVVKDLFDVTAEVTRCGSAVLGAGNADTGPTDLSAPETPAVTAAEDDAWLVAVLRKYGASLQGRTAMNEFAYGIDGRNRVTGDCSHPLDSARISGGSSSGSAWAVAAGVVPVSLGTDTGGSIRVPAAVSGIYGYRLPWNSRWLSGTFPLSPRLDTVGWFVSCAEDARLMLELTSQEASVPGSEPLPHAAARHPADGEIRLAAVIPPDVTLDSEVLQRWNEALTSFHRAQGVSLEVVNAPPVLGTEAWNAYGVIGSVDAAAVHGDWLDRYQPLYDPLVWSLIDRGRRWSPARVSTAEAVREDVTQAMHELLKTWDMLVMPVTPTASPTFARADGSFREAVLRLNVPVSLAGLAAFTVPLLHSATRSSGIQLVIPPGGEQRLGELITRLGW